MIKASVSSDKNVPLSLMADSLLSALLSLASSSSVEKFKLAYNQEFYWVLIIIKEESSLKSNLFGRVSVNQLKFEYVRTNKKALF